MIRVKKINDDIVNVFSAFLLIDRKNKTNQSFTQYTTVDTHIYCGKKFPSGKKLPNKEINKEIIYQLRKQFEVMMENLEHSITSIKRSEYLIEIGEEVKEFKNINSGEN